MKRLAALVMFLFSAIPNGQAGDSATLNILGFSEDLSVFAFEEFGIQDGSGFPYSNRFYIDVSTDRFVTGTPIRARDDDETTSLQTIRAEARAMAETATGLTDDELAQTPGTLLAFSPSTDLSRDGSFLRLLPRSVFPPIDAPLLITLDELPFEAGENCYGFRLLEMGFRLTLVEERDMGRRLVLNDDTSVPTSRNCPAGYRIAGAIMAEKDRNPSVLIVLIEVEQLGFEGPDMRWMAVSARLD